MGFILGISAYYHDSAAAIILDGKVIAAAQEERFTRKKHTEVFPEAAIRYCLKEAQVSIDQLDAVVFYDKPFLKFERLLETYYVFVPRGILSFLKAIPLWLNEKLFLKRQLKKGLKKIADYDPKQLTLLFSEHHVSHAASSYYCSEFEHAAILTIDGVGEWNTATIGLGKGSELSILRKMDFPHSVGLLYSAFTYFLGFKVNSGEYKVMGLAPYGDIDASQTQCYIELIKTEIVDIKADGSLWMNQDYFAYSTGLKMVKVNAWEKLFNLKYRHPETELTAAHCNLALAIQVVTEDIVLKMAKEAQRITGARNLCMAGGVALNCVANGKLHKAGIFDRIFVQPAAGDAGGALGAALAAYHLHFKHSRSKEVKPFDPYLGPAYDMESIEVLIQNKKAKAEQVPDFGDLCDKVSREIEQGAVVGWFQGRMEFGPRALGNRSILADPRSATMQKKLNLKIKKREGFRPFAPSVLEEYSSEFFDIDTASAYMLFTFGVLGAQSNALKIDRSLPLKEQMAKVHGPVPAVTHVDYSARVQTVSKASNEKFWQLLNAFKKLTGCPILVNTSFNVRGEPVVCSPSEAFDCFMHTDMDVLVINNYLFRKEDQLNALRYSAEKKFELD